MSRLRRNPSTSTEELVDDQDITENPAHRELSSVLARPRPSDEDDAGYSHSPDVPHSRVVPLTVLPEKRSLFGVEPVITLYAMVFAMSQPLTLEFIHHRLTASKPVISSAGSA